jgi:hypothetical protein
MALTTSEKQQVEAAVDAFLESPSVQAGVTKFIAAAEAQGENVIDTIIANAKAGGLLGGILTALKGSAEGEVNTLISSLPAATATALATKFVEGELKSLLGA